jgi:hypothetical protein
MTDERLNEIWRAVAVNAFYSVGDSDGGGSDISHQEMIELVRLAREGHKQQGE